MFFPRPGFLDSYSTRPEQRIWPSLWLVLMALASAAPAQDIEQAIAFHLEGEFDKALEAYLAVVASEETEPNVAAAAHTNSCLIHMNRGDNDAALAACESALELRRSTGDLPRTATTLNNLGLTLQNLGRLDESRDRFAEALDINRAEDAVERAVQNLSNLAGVEIQAGNYGAALDRVDKALTVADEHPNATWHHSQRRVALLNEGVALERLGAFRAALASYRNALAEGDSISENFEAILTANLGVVYRNLGDPQRAVSLFEEAAAVYRRTGNLSGSSNALLNLGLALHLNLGRPEEAEVAFRGALELARTAEDQPEIVQDLFYLASLLLEQDRTAEARGLFEEALSLAEESGSAEGRWSALYGLGRAAAADGDAEMAVHHFEQAVQVVESMRETLTATRHRGDFFGAKRPVFEAAVLAIASSSRADSAERAFTLVQQAKARELLDATGRTWVAEGPALDAIAATLDTEDLVVEFFVAEGELLRWSLTRSGELRFTNLGAVEAHAVRITRVHRALSGGLEPSRDDLEELAADLLTDLEPLEGRSLLIAPDGALRYLPFDLLPLPEAPNQRLIEIATTSILPSSSTLTSAPARTPDRELDLLALGNPQPSGSVSGARAATLMTARFGLGDLPAAAREVEAIERRLSGATKVLLHEAATETALRELSPLGSRVVHLAAHTIIDERPGRGAAVLLSPSDGDDGLLTPEEIAALDLRAELAVLSGCRTALADAASGESISSLTGAFLAAGAGGVVATLWDVDDEATAVFMDQFYWGLSRGERPADALRTAKLRLARDKTWGTAAMWSGYVLIGDPPPVARRPFWPWLLAAAVALVVVLVIGRLRRPAVY